MDAYQFNGVPVAVDEVDLDQSVVDVRSALESLRSKRSQRRQRPQMEEEEENAEHLFLILDRDTCAIPWESIPTLRSRAVSRIPSMAFLEDRLVELRGARGKTIDVEMAKKFYLINPAGDLTRTQERFEPLLAKDGKGQWTGIAGRTPLLDEYANALSSNDVVVYFGHGGAEQYIRSHKLKSLQQCAVTMLWGCSSAMLRDQGDFDRCGTAYNYVMAGCPALVGNLWDATDRELDGISESVLEKVGLTADSASAAVTKIGEKRRGKMSLTRAVAASRGVCKLPYLSGAARGHQQYCRRERLCVPLYPPTAVAAYTLTGGLRSTILADYLHTVVIFIIIFVLFFKTYATSELIGSPAAMYRLLQQAAAKNPSDNYQGSFTTLKSLGAIKFAWLSFLEYLGVVFNDASFHQKGIAANPSATVPGYVIGSLSWFTIPWTLATTAGLVALALETVSPTFPTFPSRMSKEEVSAGLVLPYAARPFSERAAARQCCFSCSCLPPRPSLHSLLPSRPSRATTCTRPTSTANAKPDQILRVQQWGVIAFSLFMAAFGSLLHGVGVDLNFLYNITGVWSTAALPQIVFSFFGDRLPTWAVFPGIWIGFGAGLAVWLSLANRLGGSVSLATLELVEVDLYTFTTCIATGILLCTIGSILTPKKIDWNNLWQHRYEGSGDEKEIAAIEADQRFSDKNLKKWLFISGIASVIIFCVFLLIWPLSLYRDYIFTQSFFTGWVIVSGIWAFLGFFAVGLFPIVEGIPTYRIIFHNILYRLGKRDAPHEGIKKEQPEVKGAQQLESSGSSATAGQGAKVQEGKRADSNDLPSPDEKKPPVAASTSSSA
ncbi:hypothetical protein L7F22_034925 [Adiantum nelumboides]|nr:hypothetical protein [Adiantum nelumboides]